MAVLHLCRKSVTPFTDINFNIYTLGGVGLLGLGFFTYLYLKQGWTKRSVPSRQEIRGYAFKTIRGLNSDPCVYAPKAIIGFFFLLEILFAFQWQCVLANPFIPKENPRNKKYFINQILLFIQLRNIKELLWCGDELV